MAHLTKFSNTPFLVSLLLVLGLAVYWLASIYCGSQKLTAAEIAAAQTASGGDDLNLEIALGFAPEQFHFLYLQEFGRMAGAGDAFIRLRGVSVQSATRLAKHYWVADIRPMVD